MSELSLPQLCQLRNYPAIAKACEQRFGVPVNEQALAAQSERVMRSHKKGFGWCWGECTWSKETAAFVEPINGTAAKVVH